MVRVHTLEIDPPVANASCAWASDYDQLRELYDSPYTGAVTTRTATLDGFTESEVNQVVFMSSSTTTLNSYGYSPHPLRLYAAWAKTLLTAPSPRGQLPSKPIIISVTSSKPDDLQEMISVLRDLRSELKSLGADPTLVAIELNTSCPNIKDTPPPSYNFASLRPLLQVLSDAYLSDPSLAFGLKLPPYLYATCFHDVLSTISSFSHHSTSSSVVVANPIAFITCTNTLGSSLLFTDQVQSATTTSSGFALPTPLGGLGGDAIHAIALGNVYTFSTLINQHPDLAVRGIRLFGAGGVTSQAAARRMYHAGASVVECASLLGTLGAKGFELLVD
ncbi:FMN-linked oxidoreductase [Phanerochaete sordida]|uniref:FMN-linked oxidoreductase n=1 Tax=Phanerochaete sordida TaxID=48140 RepID=A0A9P3G4E7_9APHY|nr:FMN-linked oxidoreductase [Phanerochaete sordida]